MITDILPRLNHVRATKPGQWLAACPAHHDKNPSLAIKELDDGKVLLHCWCGCTAQEIVKAIDLDLHYLFPANSIKTGQPPVRQWARKRLESVRKFEYLVVEIITVDFKKNRLNLHDLDRFFLACERIRKVEGVLYG